jgi:multidrug efflux system membrane fusion protein
MSSVIRRVTLVLLGSLLLAACGQGAPQQQAAPPPAVTVATPTKQSVTDYDEYVGRFVAVDMVEVRARVSGYLEKVHFRDGQNVKQGDPLFTIDRRPFEATLAQAQANLAQARANLAFASSDLARAAQLVRDRTITEQTFDQRTQAQRVAEASVAAQEAAVRQATLDVQFTELKAPVAGRIGDRRVSEGNLVTGGTGGNTTLLATIVSTDPIRLEFTFDEASYLRYQRLSGGPDEAARGKGLQVTLRLIDETDFTHKGSLDFIDNVIDRASGTIRGRAQVPNPNGLFTPGMFARVRVPGSAPYEALLVPDVAIASEQVRKYVMVVDAENMARQKFVTLGELVGKDLRVIKEGLSPDDRVVVNGLARIRPNIKVTPQEQGAEPPAAAPAPQAKS